MTALRIYSYVPAADAWLRAFGLAEEGAAAPSRPLPGLPAPSAFEAASASSKVEGQAVDPAVGREVLVVPKEPSEADRNARIGWFVFAPRTMKEALALALRLGVAVGCAERAMAVLGGLEARLQTLRAALGSGRGVPDARFPRAAVVADPHLIRLAGGWVPDLLAHAGARPLLAAAGEPDRMTTPDEMAEARPDRLFVGDHAAALHLSERLQAMGESVPITVLPTGARWREAGPVMYDVIEAMAHVLHPARLTEFGASGQG